MVMAEGAVPRKHVLPARRAEELRAQAMEGPWVELWTIGPGTLQQVLRELGVRAAALPRSARRELDRLP